MYPVAQGKGQPATCKHTAQPEFPSTAGGARPDAAQGPAPNPHLLLPTPAVTSRSGTSSLPPVPVSSLPKAGAAVWHCRVNWRLPTKQLHSSQGQGLDSETLSDLSSTTVASDDPGAAQELPLLPLPSVTKGWDHTPASPHSKHGCYSRRRLQAPLQCCWTVKWNLRRSAEASHHTTAPTCRPAPPCPPWPTESSSYPTCSWRAGHTPHSPHLVRAVSLGGPG